MTSLLCVYKEGIEKSILYIAHILFTNQCQSIVNATKSPHRRGVLLREKGQVTEAFECLDSLLTQCDGKAGGYLADYRCR